MHSKREKAIQKDRGATAFDSALEMHNAENEQSSADPVLLVIL